MERKYRVNKYKCKYLRQLFTFAFSQNTSRNQVSTRTNPTAQSKLYFIPACFTPFVIINNISLTRQVKPSVFWGFFFHLQELLRWFRTILHSFNLPLSPVTIWIRVELVIFEYFLSWTDIGYRIPFWKCHASCRLIQRERKTSRWKWTPEGGCESSAWQMWRKWVQVDKNKYSEKSLHYQSFTIIWERNVSSDKPWVSWVVIMKRD